VDRCTIHTALRRRQPAWTRRPACSPHAWPHV